MFCRKCGKEISDDSEFCFKCGTPTAEKPQQANVQQNQPKETEENPQNAQASPIFANISLVCRIISIAALVIAIILDPLIAGNMPKETFEDAANYNSVILFSYLFYGTFFICITIRVICGFVLAYYHGEFSGMWKFIIVGLIITTIIAAITKMWAPMFILFGLVTAIYVAKKLDGWI